MKLTQKLYDEMIDGRRAVIAITGGGGKTTLLRTLSSYARDKGLSVLISTTTKIQNPLFYDYEADHVFTSEQDVLMHEVKRGEKVFYAQKADYDIKRTLSPRLEVLALLSRRYDVLIYEADGSRGLPIKIHTERDPVILDGTTSVIAVMGLSAIGEKAYSVVFGDDSDIPVDARYIEKYLSDPEGLLKGMKAEMDNAVVINQADSCPEQISEISRVAFPCHAYIASEVNDEIYISL